MEIRIRESGAVTVVAISGVIDVSTAKSVEDQIVAAVKPNGKMVLDMKGVSFMSSAGVRVVLKTDQMTKRARGRVALAGLSDELMAMLTTLGILQRMLHHETLEGALAALTPGDGGGDGKR